MAWLIELEMTGQKKAEKKSCVGTELAVHSMIQAEPHGWVV